MVFNLTPVPGQVGVESPVSLQQTGQYSQARRPAPVRRLHRTGPVLRPAQQHHQRHDILPHHHSGLHGAVAAAPAQSAPLRR